MRDLGPNLAARPFANERPVKRTTLVIWTLVLTLLAINIFLYQRHLSADYDQRQTIRELQEQIRAEDEAIREKEVELAALELSQQNQKVIFLNAQIDRRTFSWSQLFDQLEEVLPANVDLHRVSPRPIRDRRRAGRSGDRDTTDLVAIEMRGDAQTGEEVLELVDRMFEHASFTSPDLMGEHQRDDGRFEFSLNVHYLPSAAYLMDTQAPQSTVEEAVLNTESTGVDR